MVAQTPAISPVSGALARAFDRAKAERLIAFPNADGTWSCKSYTLTVDNPQRLAAVTCNCPAGRAGRICKHASCVIFARKHGLRPVRPQPAVVPAPAAPKGEDFADWLTR